MRRLAPELDQEFTRRVQRRRLAALVVHDRRSRYADPRGYGCVPDAEATEVEDQALPVHVAARWVGHAVPHRRRGVVSGTWDGTKGRDLRSLRPFVPCLSGTNSSFRPVSSFSSLNQGPELRVSKMRKWVVRGRKQFSSLQVAMISNTWLMIVFQHLIDIRLQLAPKNVPERAQGPHPELSFCGTQAPA